LTKGCITAAYGRLNVFAFLWRSVKALLIYLDFSVFNMVASCHVEFLKVHNFKGHWGERINVRNHDKFRSDRSNRYKDIAIFRFSSGGRPPCWIFESLSY